MTRQPPKPLTDFQHNVLRYADGQEVNFYTRPMTDVHATLMGLRAIGLVTFRKPSLTVKGRAALEAAQEGAAA